ncbi:MAG TPA: PPOX class F420-dependent oxidoreductase [Chloroflexia bacterium]
MLRRSDITPMVIEDKVREFLKQRRFAVLVTINKDGTPQLSVMWYELQADRIMMNTAAGRVKEKNLKADPRISICVEDEYSYVTLTGRAALDYDPERSQSDIRALAVRYNGEETAERMMLNTFSKQERVTINMSIENVDSHL